MSFEIERRRIYSSGTIFRMAVPLMLSFLPVSYTHLTLPTN